MLTLKNDDKMELQKHVDQNTCQSATLRKHNISLNL